MSVVDASALLCFLLGERGAAVVERELVAGATCSAANWSEVAQKLLARGKDWPLSRRLLLSYGVAIEPVRRADAEVAALAWRRGSGLSLADRLCLATAQRLDATVWTADVAWGATGRVRQIR